MKRGWKFFRSICEVAYITGTTYMVAKWSIAYASWERGYRAIGGEYLLIMFAALLTSVVINYVFDSLEVLL